MAMNTKTLTFDAYLTLPEIKQRYEVIDGELIYTSPAPTPDHQRLLRNLFRRLDQFVQTHDLGEALFAPVDVLIRQEPLKTQQPDILFISKPRAHIIGRQLVEGGPDLAVEILSPGNTRLELEEKLDDYWRVHVQECWLVSPEGMTIEVLCHGDQGFERAGLFGVGDLISSAVLPTFRLRVEEIR
jgi:Uma2 family endonuclease